MNEGMAPKDIVLRAWKDEKFREGLPPEVRESLPPKPDNFGELNEEQLEQASGAGSPAVIGAAAGVVGAGFAVANAVHDFATDS